MGKYESKGLGLGKMIDEKQNAYGDSARKSIEIIKLFLQPYSNSDGTYTIPEELLSHLLLQIRIIDKQNRIFSNPSGDKMSESPYRDIAGYSLLGEDMTYDK